MTMANAVGKTERSKISVKNLDFYYGKFHALKGINLEAVSYTHLDVYKRQA